MANLIITVDPKKGEARLIIGNETLIIDKFLTDTEGIQVKTLSEYEQKQLARFIMREILK